MADFQTDTRVTGDAALPAPGSAAPLKPFPGFLQSLFLLLAIHLIANVVGGVLILPGMIRDYMANGTFTQAMGLAQVGIVANSLAFGLVTWITWKRSRLTSTEAFPFAASSVAQWFTMLLLFGGTVVLAEFASTILFNVLPPPDLIKEMFAQILGQDAPLLTSIIFLVIVAPITEEFFFRGVLQRSLANRYGSGRAILYSGLLFGIVHVLPWQVVPATILGILFAWCRERTGSLWPVLIMHAVVNGTSLAMSRLHPDMDPLKPEWPEPIYLAGGALFLLVGWRLAGRFLPSVPPPPSAERSLA